MARDYSKPGNTPPGTRHPRPARVAKKTWLDFVKPAPGYTPREEPKLPETVTFTRPLHDPADLGTIRPSRRERRATVRALGVPFDVKLTTEEVPFMSVVGGSRKMRRVTQANRDRRQRKGQRAFDRQQMAQARERDTITALVAVADGQTSASEIVRQNATFGLQRRMEAIRIAAEA